MDYAVSLFQLTLLKALDPTLTKAEKELSALA